MDFSSPTTTLITGANGLLGSHLVRRYLEAGHQVAALYRVGSDLSLLTDVKDHVIWHEGDILDSSSLEAAIQPNIDVIHTAAIVSFFPKEYKQMEKVNIEGTANVVNVSLNAGVRKFGFVSSVAALGRPSTKGIKTDQPIRINEDQRWESSPNNSFYARTKYRAELEVWRGIAEGLKAVIVNPSVVLGEGNWYKSSAQLFRYAFDERPFYPAGKVNVVDVKDVAEAIFQLMHRDILAERFVLSAGMMPYRTLFDKMADAFGKKRPSIYISPNLSRLMWPLEAIRAWLRGKAPLITRETARTATHSFQYDSSKIQHQLPIHFRPIDETIQRVSQYYQNQA